MAKQLLLYGTNFGIHTLDGSTYIQLQDQYFELDDPIVHDPNWKDADPSGFFERFLTQQLPAQRRNMIQKFGLALGLFRDAKPVEWPVAYDIRADVEAELGQPLEQFMAMGHLCYTLGAASLKGHQCNGTFTHLYLVEAFRQGFDFCIPEVWGKFLKKTSSNPAGFHQMSSRDLYQARQSEFAQFEFNALHRVPIIDVGNGRFVAVDPDLIVERTTLGVFYDLFERDGPDFAQRFGHVFDQFIGQLLGTVCASESLWSAATWDRGLGGRKPKNIGKHGDWVFLGESHNVIVECKSLRASLELTTYGSDDSVKATSVRIASALDQLASHDEAIQRGQWIVHGLPIKPSVGLIVTYGRLQTINGTFMRNRIKRELAALGLKSMPYVVLSLEEFDMAIRLVELGHRFDGVVTSLAAKESFEPLALFADELESEALSSFTHSKGREFMDAVSPK